MAKYVILFGLTGETALAITATRHVPVAIAPDADAFQE